MERGTYTEQLGLTCKKLSPHRVMKHVLSLLSVVCWHYILLICMDEWMDGWMGLERILRIYFAFPSSFIKPLSSRKLIYFKA